MPPIDEIERAKAAANRLALIRRLAALTLLVACALPTLQGLGLKTRLLKLLGAPMPPRYFMIVASDPAKGDDAADVAPDIRLDLDTDLVQAVAAETLNDQSVALFRTAAFTRVPVDLQFDADAKQIVLRPRQPLEPLTSYTIRVGWKLRSADGRIALPFTATFKTAAVEEDRREPLAAFQRVPLHTASDIGATCLAFGPDGDLWCSIDDGRILSFAVRADGTLEPPRQRAAMREPDDRPRIITGFCFDPHSTAVEPTLWVSNSYCALKDAPDFSGKITCVSGPHLRDVHDVVINLPRSVRDHMTNQPSFGPDGALYFPQGSNTAFGAPDEDWGNRPERLLCASILRLDVTKLRRGQTIDARTRDAGGTYDPSSSDAPLTIYAAGVRLAYDLLWHSNGMLYVPTNGSSSGGNAPQGGGAPALASIPQPEHDWLFRVERGGYYGHPNPAEGYFVLNGGNPTDDFDLAEVPQYPIGTRPDRNWRPAVYDFGPHASPNGVIEYRNRAVAAGQLAGCVMICRYNFGSDIACFGLAPDGTIAEVIKNVAGLGGLANPLDVAEDTTNGNLYVSEYGARRITLLRARR